jgi:hypothetical protein
VRDEAHHEKTVCDGVSRAEARCHICCVVTIKAGDGCANSSWALPVFDNRPAQEATCAFVAPKQFLNPHSQRRVPTARAVDKGLPLLGLQLERIYKQLLRGSSRQTHECPIQPNEGRKSPIHQVAFERLFRKSASVRGGKRIPSIYSTAAIYRAEIEAGLLTG